MAPDAGKPAREQATALSESGEEKTDQSPHQERGIQAQDCKCEFPFPSFPEFLISFLSSYSFSSSSLSLAVSSSPTAVALSPSGQRAAVGTANGMVYLLDLRTWQVGHSRWAEFASRKSLTDCPEDLSKPAPPVITLFDSATCISLTSDQRLGIKSITPSKLFAAHLPFKAVLRLYCIQHCKEHRARTSSLPTKWSALLKDMAYKVKRNQNIAM